VANAVRLVARADRDRTVHGIRGFVVAFVAPVGVGIAVTDVARTDGLVTCIAAGLPAAVAAVAFVVTPAAGAVAPAGAIACDQVAASTNHSTGRQSGHEDRDHIRRLRHQRPGQWVR
jgi:hypothetical protein